MALVWFCGLMGGRNLVLVWSGLICLVCLVYLSDLVAPLVVYIWSVLWSWSWHALESVYGLFYEFLVSCFTLDTLEAG
jgi:hypothetical protein